MTFRKIDTETWKDPWFEKLSLHARLLFIYLWTNNSTNQAGMYEISLKRIKFESGIDFNKVYPELKEKVVWFEKESVIWVKNFFRYQCQNEKFALAALSSITNLNSELQRFFQTYTIQTLKKYGIDTIDIPYPLEEEAVTEAVEEAEKKKDDCSEPLPEVSEPVGKIFIKIPLKDKTEHPIYDNQVQEWEETWSSLNVKQCLKSIRQWNISNPEKRKTKRGIKEHIRRWLEKEHNAGKNQITNISQKKFIPKRIKCERCNEFFSKYSEKDSCPLCGPEKSNPETDSFLDKATARVKSIT